MNIIALFIIGLLSFSFSIYSTYHDKIRLSGYLVYIGIICSTISNLCWYSVVKRLPKLDIFKYGFIWDGLTMLPLVLIPICIFGVSPNPRTVVGVVLVIGGIVLIRLGG